MRDVVIGLEVHAALNTKSKVFSSAKCSYDLEPNNNLSVIDLGYPGILPNLNKECINKSLMVAKVLHCNIPEQIMFDRKNYFYPDLTKGYQITQSKYPMGSNGYLMISVNDYDKKILIHDIHLEEDTASLEHFNNYSLIDYNRCGVPLVEIVTEPCISTPEEAITYLETLKRMLNYLNASYARGDKGEIRCDVNISLKDSSSQELGTKVEIKNINSFYNVKEAIAYEIKRQEEELNKGNKIIQETRRYDEKTNTTISMRSKVEAIDYKYYTEPNIPPMDTKSYLDSLDVPMLQYDRVNYYVQNYNLTKLEANILTNTKEISDYFDECLNALKEPKLFTNYINGSIMQYLNKVNININEIFLTPKRLAKILELNLKGEISSKQVKEIINFVLEEQKEPEQIISEKGMKQITDENIINDYIKEAIDDKKDLALGYKTGRNVTDYFVGQVMKKTKGQANPALTRKMVIEQLEKL